MAVLKPPIDALYSLYEYCSDTGHLVWKCGRFIGRVVSPSLNDKGYRRAWVFGRQYSQHQVIIAMLKGRWTPDGMEVDHINGIRHDNRAENLREVTLKENRQNNRNPKKHGKSGFLGVCIKNGKYRARVHSDGKDVHVGYFLTAEDAHKAYVGMKRVLHSGNTL